MWPAVIQANQYPWIYCSVMISVVTILALFKLSVFDTAIIGLAYTAGYSGRLDQAIPCALEHELCKQLIKSQLIINKLINDMTGVVHHFLILLSTKCIFVKKIDT